MKKQTLILTVKGEQLIHRGREMTLSTTTDSRYTGGALLSGRVSWSKGNYAEWANFKVQENLNGKAIYWTHDKDLSKSMKKWLTEELTQRIIVENESQKEGAFL